MKKSIFVAALVLIASAFVITKALATAIVGTAGLGDECNVHAEDASHTCEAGLVCIPKNDHSEGNGKCGSAVTPTLTPTATPTPTIICNVDHPCDTPTPTTSVTPTDSPTATPTPGSNPPSNNGGGDGHGDGLGCAVHDCSTHPASTEHVQEVLGASTMAETGTFETTVMNILAGVGMMFLALGAKSYAKDRKFVK